jgi:phenylalanyl-tRNA synthetase beta chain
VFTGVQVGPSPLWLKARLVAAGQRPINNVVDITNYAMLEVGQPMHAYDLAKVAGGRLVIDRARDGEKVTTLDGVERGLTSDHVVIRDGDGPTGIAGIMGGASSEVSEETATVLLEVANWDGVNILRTSRDLALRSEASGRFEKQLHPDLALRAQEVASRLLIDLCHAQLVPGTIEVDGEIPAPHVIELRASRVPEILGMEIPAEKCEEDLTRLGFGVTREGGRDGDVLTVTVPPDRHYDVSREADLIEEVARVNDLDKNLEPTLPATPRAGRLTREQRLLRRSEDALRDAGANEIVSWSFTDEELAGRLRLADGDPRRAAIRIANPLGADQTLMRTTLLGGLLDAAQLNLSRGSERVRLFESGHVYLDPSQMPAHAEGVLGGEYLGDVAAPAYEPHRLGALLSGPAAPSWREQDPEPDFFVAKSYVEALAAALGVELAFTAIHDEPFLHPGRAARIVLQTAGPARPAEEPPVDVGWLGELHPLVAREWDLPLSSAFELDVAPLIAASPQGSEAYEDITTHPASLQDIAVVVPEGLPAAEVRAAVLEAGGDLLRSASVFDRYSGEQVRSEHGPGKVSLALRLEFRAPDRTLTDEEVGERRDAISAALETIGGQLRG